MKLLGMIWDKFRRSENVEDDRDNSKPAPKIEYPGRTLGEMAEDYNSDLAKQVGVGDIEKLNKGE